MSRRALGKWAGAPAPLPVAIQFCIRRVNGGEVLLRDGCFTSPGNCYMREHGHTWHVPRLYSSRIKAALDHVREGFGATCEVVPYTWAREPWEREGSIIRVACNLGMGRS